MARVQSNKMKATATIYVPVSYGYNSHRRHSAVNAQLELATRAWTARSEYYRLKDIISAES